MKFQMLAAAREPEDKKKARCPVSSAEANRKRDVHEKEKAVFSTYCIVEKILLPKKKTVFSSYCIVEKILPPKKKKRSPVITVV